jgi:Aldo/keto reductase family
VREVLESTVGVEDDSLLEHRTEPVQVHLHVENILRDIGDESLDQYETADNELHDQREAAYQAALDNNADDAAADRILEDYDALADRLLAQQRQQWTSYADALTAAITDEVGAIAAEVGATPAQVAIAWLLAQGDDIAPIPGTKRVSRVEENVAADEIVLTAEQIEKLDNVTPPKGDRHTKEQRQMIDR